MTLNELICKLCQIRDFEDLGNVDVSIENSDAPIGYSIQSIISGYYDFDKNQFVSNHLWPHQHVIIILNEKP